MLKFPTKQIFKIQSLILDWSDLFVSMILIVCHGSLSRQKFLIHQACDSLDKLDPYHVRNPNASMFNVMLGKKKW